MRHELFETSASQFARSIDGLISSQCYVRGDLFVRAARASVPPNGKVLDYGCGPGRIAMLLADAGFDVRAVDPSPAMIAEAVQLAGQRERLRFAVLEDPCQELGPNSLDAVICSSVIEYVPGPEDLLRYFFAALRPSGALIISYANRRSIFRKYFEYRTAHSAAYLKVQANLWDWRTFRDLLVRAGFQPMSGPIYFDPGFQDRPFARKLCSWPWFGMLGLCVAKKIS
jgi:2-polyprenyl-3-methyl-5-hydroxy-6-metoxy-1,4-benzoquinol methylase